METGTGEQGLMQKVTTRIKTAIGTRILQASGIAMPERQPDEELVKEMSKTS
jgi:hypothetical protein